MSVDGAPFQACSLLQIAEQRATAQAASVAFRFLGNGEDETGYLTYGDLAGRARNLAGWLRGVSYPGDRAVLAYTAGLDFPVAFLACLYAGVIAVPVDVPRRKGAADGLTAIAANCGARLFLSCSAARDRLPDVGATWALTDEIAADGSAACAFAPPEPTTPAYIQYTSGSTRAPRGATVSHRALMQQLEDYRRRGGARLDDLVLVGWLPHTHDFGLVGFVLSALYLDAPYVMMPPTAFLGRPARWLEAISRYRGVYCGGPNFGYEMCAGLGPRALRSDLDLSSWRIASVGGDHIRPATLARFAAAFAPHGFDEGAWLPAYGLAESVLCATGRQGAKVKSFDAAALRRNAAVPVADGAACGVRLISCGTTMRGQEVRIVDPDTRAELPGAAVGEIWLAGRSLADGYWGDAVGTASQFHATLGGDAAGVRHLRTGDGGFLHDGELFVTGRLKDVIVVRGENHAPDDLEQTIQSVDPALRPGGGAVVQTAAQDGARLIAIQEVSSAADLDHARLFALINQAVTQLHGLTLDAIELIRAGSLPRTRNGKISRRACRAAHAEGTLRRVANWQRPLAPPALISALAVEERMLAHLRELFPDRAVGADDNLFALGLDSLAVHRLLARLNESLAVDVPLHAVFEAPTVARLASVVTGLQLHGSALPAREFVPPPAGVRVNPSADTVLDELRRLNGVVAEQTRLLREQVRLLGILAGAAPPASPVESHAPDAPADGPFPLTETQREIMMLAELRDDAEAVFNIMMVLEFSAAPDVAAVRDGLRAVTTRHEALRTVIADQQQKVLPFVEPELREVALEAGGLAGWLRTERRRPFALDRAPLWRVTLLRESDRHLFILAAHHLILDGSSLPIFVREFMAHYTGLVPADVAPPMQFRAFCRALEAAREAGDHEGRKAYWNDVLGSDLPDWARPSDAARPQRILYEADGHAILLNTGLRAALVRRGAAANATLFQTLLTAYFVLLHRVSGQERILIGIDSANRARPGEDGVIGCCNGLVPIVMDFADAPNVAQFQDKLRRHVLQAVASRDYTMTMWEQDRRIAFDPARPFKVTASMNMQRFPVPRSMLTARFDLEAQSLSQSPFGLALEVRDLDDTVRVDFVYNKQLFGAAAIERYAGYYLRLLEGIAQDGAADILSLPMLPAAEVRELLHIGRSAQAPAPFVPFLRRFAAQVAASPFAPAVACPRQRLTYRDLQERSDRIARTIVDRRVRPGTPVALLSERGSIYLAALLAILKAGCLYVPLDPKAPDARLRRQIAQADVGLLLHDEEHRDTAALVAEADARRLPTLGIDVPFAHGEGAAPAPEVGDAAPDAPVYVLFTSGSTGTPKAAVVSHGGMMNHLQAKIEALALRSGDVVAQTASQAFDISVWQQLAPLLVGACVRVFNDGVTHDPRALFCEVDQQKITVLQIVPSLLAVAVDIMIVPGRRPPLTALRWLISTGEALAAELCRRWISLYPRVPLLNAYGPTECADDVTHHAAIWPPAPEVVRTPIGRAIPGAELYVLDKRGQLAPTGAPGELHVGGACVGLGYLNDPERTATAFVPDPFAGRAQARLYRTGDLVRYREDGLLDYLGRLDQQVKVNGVRIEPREIEAAIGVDPSVLQSFVTTKQSSDGATALVAYVVLRPEKSVLEGTLKAVARNSLPQALVPSAFVFLDHLPLTASGKIDVAALPEPDLRPRKFDTTPPSTPLEELLVRIWSETIGQSGFGVHDDFFALGGRSLDATRVAKKIETHFNFRMPLSEIFRTPTVAGIAAFLERRLAAAREHDPA